MTEAKIPPATTIARLPQPPLRDCPSGHGERYPAVIASITPLSLRAKRGNLVACDQRPFASERDCHVPWPRNDRSTDPSRDHHCEIASATISKLPQWSLRAIPHCHCGHTPLSLRAKRGNPVACDQRPLAKLSGRRVAVAARNGGNEASAATNRQTMRFLDGLQPRVLADQAPDALVEPISR